MMHLLFIALSFFTACAANDVMEFDELDRDNICIIRLKDRATQEPCICVLEPNALNTESVNIAREQCSTSCALWDFYARSPRENTCNRLTHRSDNESNQIILSIEFSKNTANIAVSLDNSLEFEDAIIVSLETIASLIDDAVTLAMQSQSTNAAQDPEDPEPTETGTGTGQIQAPYSEFEAYPDEIPAVIKRSGATYTDYARQAYALALYHYYLLADFLDSSLNNVKAYFSPNRSYEKNYNR
ncbi:MAG TPA: hypothetical protein VHO47_04550 [Candidatus Babeliales bacterium]|nr:hypothetical protein [Candidatus Babeliales bacterium]